MQHAEILMLHEIPQLSINDQCNNIRVTGIVCHINRLDHHCIIQHKNVRLHVDTSILESTEVVVNDLCQIFGRLKPDKRQATMALSDGKSKIELLPYKLDATLIRKVDELDQELFEQALLAKREFLKRSNENAAQSSASCGLVASTNTMDTT